MENADTTFNMPTKINIQWFPLFDPKRYWEETENKSLQANALNKRKLKVYGDEVSNLRKHFQEKARESL